MVPAMFLFLISLAIADQSQKSGVEVNWQVISSSGGIECGSTNIRVVGTITQTAVGIVSSDNFELNHGFWQKSGTHKNCGDANGDNGVNVGDAVFLINYVFKGGQPPNPLCIGDANGDGGVNVGDAVYLIAYVFRGGPAPVVSCCP